MKKTRVKSLSRKQPYNMTLGGETNDRLINGCGNIFYHILIFPSMLKATTINLLAT